MVEIEAAQEILVGLSVAGMLGHDQPGHHLQHLARTQDRNRRQSLARHDALAARRRNPFQILGPGPHFHRRQLDRFMGRDACHSQAQI